jgi:hypothetical protein
MVVPVELVTDRAFLLKRLRAGGDGRSVRLQRIDARGRFGRHAISEQPGRNLHLDRGRRWARARQAGEREAIKSARAKDEQDEKRDDELPTHLFLPANMRSVEASAPSLHYCTITHVG